MQQQISFDDYQAVAALMYNRGFILLLEVLQANIDDLTNALDQAEPGKEQQFLAKWRAMRETYAILASTPQNFADEVKNQELMREQTFGPQIVKRVIPNQLVQSKEEIELLKKVYETKTGKKIE